MDPPESTSVMRSPKMDLIHLVNWGSFENSFMASLVRGNRTGGGYLGTLGDG